MLDAACIKYYTTCGQVKCRESARALSLRVVRTTALLTPWRPRGLSRGGEVDFTLDVEKQASPRRGDLCMSVKECAGGADKIERLGTLSARAQRPRVPQHRVDESRACAVEQALLGLVGGAEARFRGRCIAL